MDMNFHRNKFGLYHDTYDLYTTNIHDLERYIDSAHWTMVLTFQQKANLNLNYQIAIF